MTLVLRTINHMVWGMFFLWVLNDYSAFNHTTASFWAKSLACALGNGIGLLVWMKGQKK